MTKRLPSVRLSEVKNESFYKKDVFPVAASDPDDWRQFLDMLSELSTGDNWLGYEVTDKTVYSIRHTAFFMGRQTDAKAGHFLTLELVGPKGGFKLSICDISQTSRPVGKLKTPLEKAQIDVRATSQEFMDLLYIMMKSSI